MARKLSQITNKVSGFLLANYGDRKICNEPIVCKQGHSQLPDSLLMTYTVGKAQFDLDFYQYIIQKNFIHPDSQSRLYKLLIKDKTHIKEIIELSNTLKYFNIKYDDNNQQDYLNGCFVCYCILIAIANNKNDALTKTLTNGYYSHFLPTLFPSKSNSNDIGKLSKEISSIIAKKWNKKATLKESYQVKQDNVNFRLLAITDGGKKIELIHEKGNRLKPTRIQTYQKLLMQVQSDYYHFPVPE